MNSTWIKLAAVFFVLAFFTASAGFGQTCNPCFAIVDGGNWNSAASWSNSSGGGATTNVPGAGDTIIIGEAGNMNINLTASTSIAKIKIHGTGSLTYNASNVNLTITDGDSLILMDGSQINENSQTNARIIISGTSSLDILAEGTGTRINNVDLFQVQNTGTTTFYGSGDILVNGQFRWLASSVGANNMTGNLNVASFIFFGSNQTFTNNGRVNCSGNIELQGANTNFTNNDTIVCGNSMASNGSGDDGHVLNNNDYWEVTGNIDFFDADWTINNSATFVHSGDFAQTAGSEVINNLNGGTWYTAAASHSGITMNCDDATNTFVYNGSGAQDVFVPSDGEYSNLTFENTGLKTITGGVIVQETLTLTAGNIDISSNSVTLGTAPGTPGTLVYTDGGFYGGNFIRYFDAATVADGNIAGMFPMANSTPDVRPLFISAPSVAPSTGGTITVSTSNITTVTDVSVADDQTILRRYDGNWTVSSGGGLAGGTYNVRGGGTGFGEIGDVTDLRLMQSGSVVGSPGTNGGTTVNPEVNRTGLTVAELGNDFFVGSVAAIRSPLPVDLLDFSAECFKDKVAVSWIVAEEDYPVLILERSFDGLVWSRIEEENILKMESNPSGYHSCIPASNKMEYFRLIDPTDAEIAGIKNVFCTDVEDELKAYPNPADESFFILGSTEIVGFDFRDSRGNIILREQGRINTFPIRIITASLTEGIYLLRMYREDGSVTIKRMTVSH